MLALRALRSSQREAVVLTLYLDLSEEEAAAITGASQAALRRALASAVRTLRAELAAET